MKMDFTGEKEIVTYNSVHMEKYKTPFLHTWLADHFGERYTQYRTAWLTRQTVPSLFPLQIDIELINACNMHCSICNVPKHWHDHLARLTPQNLYAIFDEASRYDSFSAANFGTCAEPLLDKPLLYEGIHLAAQAGAMDIFVHTNGLLLDDSTIDSLLDSEMTVLCISLDASSPETYVAIRGQNVLPKIESAILRILDCRSSRHKPMAVRVSFCVCSANCHEKDSFLHKWQGTVDWIDFQAYTKIDGNLSVNDNFDLILDSSCDQPFKRLQIGSDGTMYPCCCASNNDLRLGSIHTESIAQAWHGIRAKSIRSSLLGNEECLPGYCQQCLNSLYRYKG